MKTLKKIMMTILLLSVVMLQAQNKNQSAKELNSVFEHYFTVKDDLVKTDRKATMKNSTELLNAINAVKMQSLNPDTHTVWMKVNKNLSADAKIMSETSDVQKQRTAFKTLSQNMFELIKVSKLDETVYYQYCPMQDAYWVSKESKVKNPYYGSQMLTCGKVVETIK